jgi:hypothetical protein
MNATSQALGNPTSVDPKSMLPHELERQYSVYIIHGVNAKKGSQRMRDIRSA